MAPFHRTFGWFIVLLVVYEAFQIVDSYILSLVIGLFGQGAQQYIWIGLVVVLVIYDELFNRLDNHLDWHIIVKHSYPIYKRIKLAAVKKFLDLDISWHRNNNSGALVGKVNNGTWKIMEIIDTLSWEFVPTLIQALLSVIPLVIISPLITIVALVSLVIFLWLTIKSNKERMLPRKLRHDEYENEWHQSVEMVQSIETVISFNQKNRLLEEYEKVNESIIKYGKTEAKKGIFVYNRWRIRVLSVARRLVLVIWIWQLYQGTLDIAGLVFVNTLTERLFHSFWRFARLFDRATEASEAANRLVNLLDEKPTIIDKGKPGNTPTTLGIEFNNVCFSYTDNYDKNIGTIHDLNLTIDPGSIVALVGPSGAGKTTIRKILPRLIDIQSGNIMIGGKNIVDWPLEKLRKAISYVPQGDDVDIYSSSVRDNIAFPKPDVELAQVVRAAKLAGIHDFIIEELDDGYDTRLGERGKKLSGGQKQRMALARAILADRPILILDEATSSIDAITEKEIQNKMRSILAGKTAIIVAHRLSTIWDLADKIVVLDNGKKIEEGTHSELITNAGLYSKMVKLQTYD